MPGRVLFSVFGAADGLEKIFYIFRHREGFLGEQNEVLKLSVSCFFWEFSCKLKEMRNRRAKSLRLQFLNQIQRSDG